MSTQAESLAGYIGKQTENRNKSETRANYECSPRSEKTPYDACNNACQQERNTRNKIEYTKCTSSQFGGRRVRHEFGEQALGHPHVKSPERDPEQRG